MIELEDAQSLKHAPDNLLPNALLDLLGSVSDTVPSLIVRQQNGETNFRELSTKQWANAILRGSFGFEQEGSDDIESPANAVRSTLGPRRNNPLRQVPRELEFRPAGKEKYLFHPARIGIIDAGMAFWNPDFWKDENSGPDIQTFSVLSLTSDVPIVRQELSQRQFDQMVADRSNTGANEMNHRKVATQFGHSIFHTPNGQRPLYPPHGFGHGTAMIELVRSTAPQSAELHLMELPREVVRDLTGGLLRAVIDLAIRSIVDQMSAHAEETSREFPAQTPIVILLAFGFSGGPQKDGAPLPEIASRLQETLNDLATAGYGDVTLVVPMGNQRQDQGHARLAPGQSVEWRLQPDDHSINTLEIISPTREASLTLTAPDGTDVRFTPENDTYRKLLCDGKPCGAIWTRALDTTHFAMRISLAPTATIEAGSLVAPFGTFKVTAGPETHLDMWVLRDETGYEVDDREPYRNSWLEDEHYQRTDSLGLPELDDPTPAKSVVLRAGSASALSVATPGTSAWHKILAVGAAWNEDATQIAPYSGQFAQANKPRDLVFPGEHAAPEQQPRGPFGTRAVLGNGSDARFHVSGTSVAAALAAGKAAV